MRDPGLPEEFFVRDAVRGREALWEPRDLERLPTSMPHPEGVRFASDHRLTVELPVGPGDLSRFDCIVLRVLNLSRSRVLTDMRLLHSPQDESSPRRVSLSGGRENLPANEWTWLKFPRECFGTYGKPSGWGDVHCMELSFGREKTSSQPGPVDLVIGSLEGCLRRIPSGPRLTEAGLREVLRPDLEENAGARGFSSAISMGLKPYSYGNTSLLVPPPHPYPKESADDVIAGRILGQRLPEPIPWDADPHEALEWRHFLHRHHFLREVVRGFAETRDSRYAHHLKSVVESWIRSNPVPVDSNGGAGPSWETLTAAWRLREWLWIAGIAWEDPSFGHSTRTMMLRSIWEHARSLMDHTGHPNNWIIVESAALALAGICFPIFNEAPQWRSTGLKRLREEFHRQFFPDGTHFELSPLYQSICLHALLEVGEAARFNGIDLPDFFGESVRCCWDYLASLCRPDFTWPSLNDSGSTSGDFGVLMRKVGEVLDSPHLTWIGSRGRSGTAPAGVSRVFPDAGVAVMRLGRGPNANELLFRTGPAGASHVHGDALSVEVTALGITRLADPGITSYSPDVLTDYYRSAVAHNMVLVDGKGPLRGALSYAQRIRPAGGNFSFTTRESLEIATGVCRGPWERIEDDITWLRTVIFVKPDYWVVRDLVTGQGNHEVTACWQFMPGRVEIDMKSLAARCVDATGPRFELIPAAGPHVIEIEQSSGASHPPRGWFSVGGRDLPGTTVQYHVRGGFPLTLLWVLFPFDGRPVSGVKASRTDRGTDHVCLELEFPDARRDAIALTNPQSEDIVAGDERLHGCIEFARKRG